MSGHCGQDWRQSLVGKTIHLAFYCHADWQWEQSRRWHEDRYALVVREVLDWMAKTDDLTMVIDNINEFIDPVWQRLTASERARLVHYVVEGRIGIAPAGIANGRPTHIGDETFIRNLVIGRRRFAELFPGADLGVFHSVDISVGHSQMPQLITQAGFDSYRAWRPEGPLDADGVPRQFMWQGLDGSTVLVFRGPYGSLYLSGDLPDARAGWGAAAQVFYAQVLAAQCVPGRTPTSHLMAYVGCDDGRPFRTHDGDVLFDLPGFLAEWRRRESAPIVFDRPCDVRDALLSERAKLPTVHGTIDGAECGYNVSWRGKEGLWCWRTGNDLALVEAERWASLAWWHGAPYPEEDMAAMWRDHLTYQPHAQEAAFAPDFEALVAIARSVKDRADRLARQARLFLAGEAAGGDACTHYIYNPHAWPVVDFVEVYHACTTPGAQSLIATDDAGNRLQCQMLDELRHPRFAGAINDARLLAKVEVPAGGIRRVHIEESPEPAAAPAGAPTSELRTTGLELRFGGDALREVAVRQTYQAYLDPAGAPWPSLTYHLTDDVGWYGPRQDHERIEWRPRQSDWLEAGPFRWCHRARGSLGHFDAELLTYAWRDEPRLDFTVHLLDNGAARPPAGIVTLRLPLPADGRLWGDIPFGVEERRPQEYRYMDRPGSGAEGCPMFERPRDNLFWARSWVHWAGDGNGLTLVSADGGIYYLYEDGYLAHVLGRWMRPSPGSWEARAWPELACRPSRQSFSYSVLFGQAKPPSRETIRLAALRRMPLTVEHPPAPRGDTARALAGIAIDGPAMLSAAYVEGDACFVRLFECDGTGGEATCRLPGRAATAMAVDLLGNQLTDVELELREDRLRLRLRPWQIVTVRVERMAAR